MNAPTNGWSNKRGTSDRACNCGSWSQHWLNYTNPRQSWPMQCSVNGCSSRATLGGHIINPQVAGEKIVPLCNSCNGLSVPFNLKNGIQLPSANTSETCGK